jgi:hypothetical protein
LLQASISHAKDEMVSLELIEKNLAKNDLVCELTEIDTMPRFHKKWLATTPTLKPTILFQNGKQMISRRRSGST